MFLIKRFCCHLAFGAGWKGGLERGWGKVGDGLGKGRGGLAFQTSKTVFEQTVSVP